MKCNDRDIDGTYSADGEAEIITNANNHERDYRLEYDWPTI